MSDHYDGRDDANDGATANHHTGEHRPHLPRHAAVRKGEKALLAKAFWPLLFPNVAFYLTWAGMYIMTAMEMNGTRVLALGNWRWVSMSQTIWTFLMGFIVLGHSWKGIWMRNQKVKLRVFDRNNYRWYMISAVFSMLVSLYIWVGIMTEYAQLSSDRINEWDNFSAGITVTWLDTSRRITSYFTIFNALTFVAIVLFINVVHAYMNPLLAGAILTHDKADALSETQIAAAEELEEGD